jgi:transposase
VLLRLVGYASRSPLFSDCGVERTLSFRLERFAKRVISCNYVAHGIYSKELRTRAVAAVDRGTPTKEVVQIFSISLTMLKRRLKMKREGKKDLSTGTSTGRKRRILATFEEKRTLWKQLEENNDATLEHHCQMWEEKTGARLYMRKVLVPTPEDWTDRHHGQPLRTQECLGEGSH